MRLVFSDHLSTRTCNGLGISRLEEMACKHDYIARCRLGVVVGDSLHHIRCSQCGDQFLSDSDGGNTCVNCASMLGSETWRR
jgi:hypothetical protein